MLARRLTTILPPPTRDEVIEVSTIWSVAGLLPKPGTLVTQRPFRAPHHTISVSGLIGGGSPPHPGEVTLAHRGVLFLDELPEFNRIALETLRQPIEDKAVTIARARGSMTFPSSFMLLAAMNPCPCGFHGDPRKACACGKATVQKYQARISGPLMDRIDLFVDVPRVEYDKLVEERRGETSETVRRRVERARAVQLARFRRGRNGEPLRYTCNAEIAASDIWDLCP
ncbi:MAG: ATP-binding protein, partial [Candidatus Rokubacteria bacterium]|nr:ATP-binding protein [Candidatus Rokubacteria bacterium]